MEQTAAIVTESEKRAFNAGVMAAKDKLGNCFSGTKDTKMLRYAIDRAAQFGDANGYVHRWYKSTQKELDTLLKIIASDHIHTPEQQ